MPKPVSLESFLWLGQLGIHDKQGRSFRSVAIKLTVPKEIMDMSLAEGIQMYSASHVENQGCELRKASKNHGRSGFGCDKVVRMR